MTTDRLELRRSVAGLATTLVLLALAMVPAVWGVWHARGPLWGRVSFVALLAASFLALVVIGVNGYRSFISDDGVHQPALLGDRERSSPGSTWSMSNSSAACRCTCAPASAASCFRCTPSPIPRT
jgi:hypothetical protein